MALAACCVTVSCSDDDEPVSAKAVLASASSLTFEGVSAAPQTIVVTSDADWYSEAPENITITPSTGHAGQTEVTVSITDNMRDGALDNPHDYEIVFRGNTKKSMAIVKVFQLGDTYRGVADYKIVELVTAPDNTAVQMPGMTIIAKLNAGAVATDGTDLVYVSGNPEGVEVGTTGIVKGTKFTDAAGMPYVVCEIFQAQSTGTYTPGTPEDITANFGSYSSDAIKYVTVNCLVSAGKFTVEGQNGSLEVVDAPVGTDLGALDNHNVKVTGYYAGKKGSTHRLYMTAVEDLGLYQVVYWSEDFEWLEPWSSQKPAGRTVEENNSNATAQQLGTNKVDGVSTYAALCARGYTFLTVHDPAKSERKPEAQIYLQRNYLKFGLTGYQSGIKLPPITTVPEGAKVTINFDWSVQRQTSGVFDKTKLVVIVKNGTAESQFEVPPHDFKDNDAYRWIPVSIDLSSVKIGKDTEISIRNCDEQWPCAEAARYHLDNIKIVDKGE